MVTKWRRTLQLRLSKLEVFNGSCTMQQFGDGGISIPPPSLSDLPSNLPRGYFADAVFLACLQMKEMKRRTGMASRLQAAPRAYAEGKEVLNGSGGSLT